MPERKIRQIEKLIAELTLEVEAAKVPIDPSLAPWKRWWRGFVSVSRKSVILTVRSAVGATVIVVVGFFALRNQTENVANNRIADNAALAAVGIYDNALGLYTTSALNRTICLNGVEASGRNRAMWEITVGLLNQAGLTDAADTLSRGPLLEAPPRLESECPMVAELPIDPRTGLTPPIDPDTLLPVPTTNVTPGEG